MLLKRYNKILTTIVLSVTYLGKRIISNLFYADEKVNWKHKINIKSN